jgi:hypothetical protein
MFFEIWCKYTTFILFRKFFTEKIAIMDKYLTFTNQTMHITLLL